MGNPEIPSRQKFKIFLHQFKNSIVQSTRPVPVLVLNIVQKNSTTPTEYTLAEISNCPKKITKPSDNLRTGATSQVVSKTVAQKIYSCKKSSYTTTTTTTTLMYVEF